MKEYVKPSVAVYLAQHESALLEISAETTNPKKVATQQEAIKQHQTPLDLHRQKNNGLMKKNNQFLTLKCNDE